MPLTAKGEKIKSAMEEEYGKEKGEEVFYASKNAGKISGVDFLPVAAVVGARVGSAMVNPLGASSTASQAQENAVMGRPSNAGSFGQTPPVTGDTHRVVASLDDLATAGGRRR